MTVVCGVSVLPVPPQVTVSKAPKSGPWRGPDLGRMIRQAWSGMAPLLCPGGWVDRAVLVDAAVTASSVLPETATGMLSEAHQYGVVERVVEEGVVSFRATQFGRWCRPELATS